MTTNLEERTRELVRTAQNNGYLTLHLSYSRLEDAIAALAQAAAPATKEE